MKIHPSSQGWWKAQVKFLSPENVSGALQRKKKQNIVAAFSKTTEVDFKM